MYTTQLDNGITNNKSIKTEVYYAEYPAPFQQRRYLIQGVVATLFVTSLIVVSFIVS